MSEKNCLPAPSRKIPVAVLPLATFSMVVLALEVLLTRILSYSVHTVLLYVVLGIAMLGFGAAGSLVAIRSEWLKPEKLDAALTSAALVCVVSIIVGYALFLRITPVLYDINVFTFMVACFLTAPFLAAGTVITLALSSSGNKLGQCYAANLIGSGLGCFLPLMFLEPLGADYFLALLAGIAWVAAFMYLRVSKPTPNSTLRHATAGVLFLVVLAFIGAPQLFPIHPEPAPLGQLAKVREYAKEINGGEKRVYDRWNAIGRIEIFQYSFPGYSDPYPYLLYTQDSSAGSMLVRWDNPKQDILPENRKQPESIVARMCTESIYGQAYYRSRPKVMIIGVGGGPDLQCALYHRSNDVDVVEINPAAISAIKGPFNHWLGGIGNEPNVHFYKQDGRSFAHGAHDSDYDLIQMSGADTKQELASGALTLNENYLYTEEAFVDYLKSLAPNGVLSIIRFGEVEALRLANIASSALRRLGVARPNLNIAVLQSGIVYGVIVQRKGFSSKDIDTMVTHTKPLRPVGPKPFFYAIEDPVSRPVSVLYTPQTDRKNIFSKFFAQISQGNAKTFRDSYPFEISPTVDDRPFFFDMYRYDKMETWAFATHLVMLRDLLTSILFLSVLLVLLPVRRMRERLRGLSAIVAPAFFVSIGVAYLMIEVWMLHRFSLFLGHQTYSFIIVLSTLLISTGIGAWQGERFIPRYGRRALIGSATIVLLLILGTFFLPSIIEGAWKMSLPLRALIAMAFVAPTGIAMGLPFPAGLNWIQKTYPSTLPWCVGINGFASVLSTILVIPISVLIGYSAILVTGGGLYALAGILALTIRESPSGP